MSDAEVTSHLRAAPVLGSGIGGVRQSIRVGDVRVFVKRIPITDRERLNANLESTANLFGLPVGCQYGIGSPSFGVWREIAANTMATGWVLDGQAICHPLMYHWRVVDEPEPHGPLCDELADIDRLVEYWHGSATVRQRAEAITAATASAVLFLEYVPTTLPDWLHQQLARDEATANAAIEMVAEHLRVDVASMNNRGLFHFDAHLDNMLCDGDNIYIADFGLATSPGFDLSDVEARFLELNASHDVAHTMTRFVDWLVTEFVTGADYLRRNDFVRACASGRADTATLPMAARKVIDRYAPLAVLINDFYLRLHREDRNSPYPSRAIERACLNAGLVIPRPQPG
jgi:hypothetical protein